MIGKRIFKFFRSLIKLILPILFYILLKLKINRRVINFLEEKSYFSNNSQNFSNIISDILKNKKIVALDVGAQGGFNSDNFFQKRYNKFFEDILVEPIKSEADKIKEKKYVINKGIWSTKEKKKLFILGNRLGSSSMYEPDQEKFSIHNIKRNEFENYKITRIEDIDCDSIHNLLNFLKVEKLDYLKVDTQGAELEILKGLGDYYPLLIKIEVHIFSMYKNVPSWDQLINFLYDKGYVAIDWKGIGKHLTRIPAEIDMIFIPEFNSEHGKKLILNNIEKFVSLMLIFGQINLLKVILKKFKLENKEIEKIQDLYFD